MRTRSPLIKNPTRAVFDRVVEETDKKLGSRAGTEPQVRGLYHDGIWWIWSGHSWTHGDAIEELAIPRDVAARHGLYDHVLQFELFLVREDDALGEHVTSVCFGGDVSVQTAPFLKGYKVY